MRGSEKMAVVTIQLDSLGKFLGISVMVINDDKVTRW